MTGVILVSCSSTAPSLDTTATPAQNSSFVAGRFSFEWDHTFLRLALEISCGGSSTFIEMSKGTELPPLQIFSIPSGECFLVGIAPMGGIGDRESTITFGDGPQTTFSALPGNIYYIGNLKAAAFYSENEARASSGYISSWLGKYITLRQSSGNEENPAELIYHQFPKFEGVDVTAVNPLNKYGQQGRAYSAPLP